VVLHEAVGEAPKDAELRRQLGLFYVEAGDGSAGENALSVARKLGASEDDPFNLAMARALFLQSKNRELVAFLDRKSFSTNDRALAGAILDAKALDWIDQRRSKYAFLEILKQLDRRSFPHSDPIDAAGIVDALREVRSRYASLDAAFDYRDHLAN